MTNRNDTPPQGESLNQIVEIDQFTGAVIKTIDAPNTVAIVGGLAFDGADLWFVEGLVGPEPEDSIYRIDPDTGSVTEFDLQPVFGNTNIDGLAALNGKIYMHELEDNVIYVFDPANPSVGSTIQLGSGISLRGGLAAMEGSDVLIATQRNPDSSVTFYEIDPNAPIPSAQPLFTKTFPHTVNGLGILGNEIHVLMLDLDVQVLNSTGTILRSYQITPGAATSHISARNMAGGGPVVGDMIGVHRDRSFYLDANANGVWDPVNGDLFSSFGLVNDTPLAGDWNGDGADEIGVHRGNQFFFDMNGDGIWNGVAGGDAVVTFGSSTDTPLTGDWNGDGVDDIGVHRGNQFWLDFNGNGVWDGVGPGLDVIYTFGIVGDTPLVGDWNGDGKDEIGIHRNREFYLDSNGNGAWDAAVDEVISFGLTTDTPIIGDWDGDGDDDIGVHRGNQFWLDFNGSRVWDTGDVVYTFGNSTDTPLIGKWHRP